MLPDDTLRDGVDGGGFVNLSGDSFANFTHVTIADNESTRNGGGIHRSSGTVTITNTIVADNRGNVDATPTGSDVHGDYVAEGTNIVEFHPGGSQTGGGTVLTTDPQLAALADNGGLTWTHAISTGSSAENAAAGSAAMVDQRGVARPQAAIADLGAYEIVASIPTITGFVVPPTGEEGTPVNLSASAVGTAPFTFTWTITRPDSTTETLVGDTPPTHPPWAANSRPGWSSPTPTATRPPMRP